MDGSGQCVRRIHLPLRELYPQHRAYLLEWDDREIGHLVYPTDLVDYARNLRNEGRHTS